MSQAERDPRRGLVEGPSATNSPDNADSGSAAYVIFAVAVALLVGLATVLGGCVGSVAQLALYGLDDYGGYVRYDTGTGTRHDGDGLNDYVMELLGDSAASDGASSPSMSS